jgi:hypothetical protein
MGLSPVVAHTFLVRAVGANMDLDRRLHKLLPRQIKHSLNNLEKKGKKDESSDIYERNWYFLFADYNGTRALEWGTRHGLVPRRSAFFCVGSNVKMDRQRNLMIVQQT